MSDRTHARCLIVLCTVALSFAAQAALAADRPNIVIIMTDDQGWGDLGVHGNPVLSTPNMDRLCNEGVELTRFYVSPVCSLTRASLMTGRYPLRTGVWDTRNGHDSLKATEVTLADMLKAANYKTGLFGKWHLGRYLPNHPNRRGFDEFFGFWQYGHVERYVHPDQLWHNRERVECRGHITELITDAAIDFVTSADRPFFCYLAYNVPHAPFLAQEDLVAKYLQSGVPLRDAQIYALVEQCDTQIGRLLAAIDERGIRNDTAVFFMSDNGGISRHYSGGLRGSKGTLHEGGIRSPFFARLPGQFPAGKKSPVLSDVIDILPTVAELVGVNVPEEQAVDGVSLVKWLRGGDQGAPHEYLCHSWSREVPKADVSWEIQTATHKLLNGALFNLAEDEGQSRDLAASFPDLVNELRAEYVRWFNDVTAGQTYGRATIEVGREDENPVELQPSWADLHGDATTYTFSGYDWDVIDGWKKPGDAATWETVVVQPGRYEVSIAYGCGRDDAGGSFAVRVGDSEVRGKVEATPISDIFVTRKLGVVSLPKGPATIRFEVVDAAGKQLMALNRVWLKRL